MNQVTCLFFSLIFSSVVFAQKAQYYKNNGGENHLCGIFPIEALEKDTVFQKWYNKGYNDFTPVNKKHTWISNLKDVEVDIYLGTWCGDSKKWVPRFIKLWDELGLKRKQLKFIALYDFFEGKYKQGPNGEEKGKNIHRIPTFIFKKDKKEIARIVESPNNDLETDLAQIALAIPSNPNYRGASYMMKLFEKNTNDEIRDNNDYFNTVHHLVKSPSELNTLGYVYLKSNKIAEALTVFYYNIRCYKHNPNVYDSYAEALAKAGNIKDAIRNYEKILLLDRSNRHAQKQIQKLKKEKT